jgi:putative MATE family efflux protein
VSYRSCKPLSVLSATTTAANASSKKTYDNEEVDENGKKTYNWAAQNYQLAIPALIGMLADPLLSLMDTAYVGRVGTTELAALGACTSIFHLAFHAFRATTAATTSLIGSASTEVEKQEITMISLTLGVFLGFALLGVLRAAGPWCLHTMGVPRSSALFIPADAYLKTRMWAAPVVLMIVVAEGAFRGEGNTRIPLLASLTASVVNFVLDPILMFPLGMGVRGAAAATAVSQFCAAAVFMYFLVQRNMLPGRTTNKDDTEQIHANRWSVIKAILGANLAMVCKQGSLLLAWAYATARATRIGHTQVATHQIALSCWLVFALILDGAAVSGQVLMSRSLGQLKKVRSLISYMLRFASLQGLVTTGLVLAVGPILPQFFTPDPVIGAQLHALMPQLAWQQLLVSLTLVTESLAIGGNQFRLLAVGTTLSTIVSMWQLKQATTLVDIWSRGIVALFAGRLITSLIGIFRVLHSHMENEKDEE